MVRRQGDAVTLESFARCPKCGRNDKVEKVSAILRKQEYDIYKIKNIRLTYINKKGLEETALFQSQIKNDNVPKLIKMLTLNPLELPFAPYVSIGEPLSKIKWGIYLVIASVFVSIIAIFSTKGSINGNVSFDCSTALILLFLILLIMGIRLIRLGKRKRDPALQENIKIEKKFQNVLQLWREKNRQKKKLHSNLYYCNRDDIIFLPRTGNFALVEKMEDYLESHLKS